MSTEVSPYYSQFGEDRILDRLFRGKRKGFCVEVGANNGVDGSTTLHFEELGWDCILVEPNPTLCRELRAHVSTRRIPVIVFSILAAGSRADEAGATAFLRKPFVESVFLKTVEGAIAARPAILSLEQK